MYESKLETLTAGAIRLPLADRSFESMLSRTPDRASRLRRRPSFAGDAIAVRMRSLSFALFGGGALIGLLLVAILAQSGLTALPPLPIPVLGSGDEAVSDASVAPGRSAPAQPVRFFAPVGEPGPSPTSAAAPRPTAAVRSPAADSAPSSSPPAAATPVAAGPSPQPPSATADPQPVAATAPADPTTAPAAPVEAAGGESSTAASPTAAGVGSSGSSGSHWHGPALTSPSYGHGHGHSGGHSSSPGTTSWPAHGPEATRTAEPVAPPEDSHGSWGGHGHGGDDDFGGEQGHGGDHGH